MMHLSFLVTLFFLLYQGESSLAHRLKLEEETFMENEKPLLTALKKTTKEGKGSLEWKRNSLSGSRFVMHLEMGHYSRVTPRKVTLDFPVHRDAKKHIWYIKVDEALTGNPSMELSGGSQNEYEIAYELSLARLLRQSDVSYSETVTVKKKIQVAADGRLEIVLKYRPNKLIHFPVFPVPDQGPGEPKLHYTIPAEVRDLKTHQQKMWELGHFFLRLPNDPIMHDTKGLIDVYTFEEDSEPSQSKEAASNSEESHPTHPTSESQPVA